MPFGLRFWYTIQWAISFESVLEHVHSYLAIIYVNYLSKDKATLSFEDHAALNTWLGKQCSIVLDLTRNIFLSLYFLLERIFLLNLI